MGEWPPRGGVGGPTLLVNVTGTGLARRVAAGCPPRLGRLHLDLVDLVEGTAHRRGVLTGVTERFSPITMRYQVPASAAGAQ